MRKIVSGIAVACALFLVAEPAGATLAAPKKKETAGATQAAPKKKEAAGATKAEPKKKEAAGAAKAEPKKKEALGAKKAEPKKDAKGVTSAASKVKEKTKAVLAALKKKKALPPPALSGIASVYAYKKRSRSASGEFINFKTMIAAHRSFRFGTKVLVTNRRNGKSVIVRIIDRGPFIRGRVIDLSPAAAREIGMGWGLAPVTLAVVTNKKA